MSLFSRMNVTFVDQGSDVAAGVASSGENSQRKLRFKLGSLAAE